MMTHEPSTSKMIPANKCYVVTPNISHGPLVQVTRSLTETATSLPTTFQTIQKSMANSSHLRAEGGTILLGKQQMYQLVKGPPSQIKTIAKGTNNISVQLPQTDDNKVCKIH